MSFIPRFLIFSVLQSALLIPALAAKTDAGANITNQINEILRERDLHEYGDTVSQFATLLTPDELPDELCTAPVLSVPDSPRLTGNRSVHAKCSGQNFYLQIAVQAEGSYWVATHNLPAGQPLTSEDIRKTRGRWIVCRSGYYSAQRQQPVCCQPGHWKQASH